MIWIKTGYLYPVGNVINTSHCTCRWQHKCIYCLKGLMVNSTLNIRNYLPSRGRGVWRGLDVRGKTTEKTWWFQNELLSLLLPRNSLLSKSCFPNFEIAQHWKNILCLSPQILLLACQITSNYVNVSIVNPACCNHVLVKFNMEKRAWLLAWLIVEHRRQQQDE